MTTIFRSSPAYYSHAFRCWRIEVREYTADGDWRSERIAYFEIERKEDADAIDVLMRAVKKYSDFELLISVVQERVMKHSKTKGTCYVYSQKHRGTPLHKAEG